MERAGLITGPTPGLATYGATKAAVISLTKSLNEELDGDGVRAVAICPGFVDTPMAEWSGLPGEEMIQPEDCAEVVRMCLRLSPHARVPQVVIECGPGVRAPWPNCLLLAQDTAGLTNPPMSLGQRNARRRVTFGTARRVTGHRPPRLLPPTSIVRAGRLDASAEIERE